MALWLQAKVRERVLWLRLRLYAGYVSVAQRLQRQYVACGAIIITSMPSPTLSLA